jgi:integrase
LLALEWDCVKINNTADENGLWGILEIWRGLKREARRRNLPIMEDMAAVLLNFKAESKCQHVFTSLQDHTQLLSRNPLANQHRDLMETCSFHPDAGLHALRHTFLTEAGRHTQNVKALQKLAGHSRIETTMRYMHPDQEDVLNIVSAVQRKKVSGVATVGEQVTQQQRKM